MPEIVRRSAEAEAAEKTLLDAVRKTLVAHADLLGHAAQFENKALGEMVADYAQSVFLSGNSAGTVSSRAAQRVAWLVKTPVDAKRMSAKSPEELDDVPQWEPLFLRRYIELHEHDGVLVRDGGPTATLEALVARATPKNLDLPGNQCAIYAPALRLMASHKDPEMCAMVARHGCVPPDVVAILLAHPDGTVRASTAKHSWSAETLVQLSLDPDVRVRLAVAQNQQTPIETLKTMKNDADAEVARAADSNVTWRTVGVGRENFMR